MQPSRRCVFGLNGPVTAIPSAAVPLLSPETNSATSWISCSLSCPSNDGIPPPPLFTFCSTWSTDGSSSSRFGPTDPFDPAALNVWQLPHPASANTLAPALSEDSPESPPPQPVSARSARAKITRLTGTQGRPWLGDCQRRRYDGRDGRRRARDARRAQVARRLPDPPAGDQREAARVSRLGRDR